jgi:hypothetical protein
VGKLKLAELFECGVDAASNCGAPVVPVVKRVTDYDVANPLQLVILNLD